MTNYDYLRGLSPEEMAYEFNRVDWCDSSCACGDGAEKCGECLLAWLKSPRKDGNYQ